MGEFNKEASIVGQNAGGTAATLMAAYVASSYVSLEEFLRDFNVVRTEVMNGSVALAGAEQFIEAFGKAPASAPQRGGNSNFRSGGARPSTSVNSGDPGSTVANFGKHKGKTLSAILDEEPSYVEWLAENAQQADVRAAAATLIAA